MKKINWVHRTAWLAGWSVCVAGTASAATIRSDMIEVQGQAIRTITVSGELENADGEKFFRLAMQSKQGTIVFLEGPGGSLRAGIEIGRAIRLAGYPTAVVDQSACASACAYAWLGGRKRYMGASARIGFHAAFHTSRPGSASGMGNALLGAYLNQLDLPMAAIAYMTEAEPNTMRWLTLRDAAQYGIAVESVEDAAPSPPPRRAPTVPPAVTALPPAPVMTADSQRARVNAQAQRYLEVWNQPNHRSLASLGLFYADIVNAFGKNTSRAELMKSKVEFSNRWPERQYRYIPGTLGVHCSKDLCMTQGVVEWNVRSAARQAASTGTAQFTLGFEAQTMKIVLENSEVLTRKVSKAP